MTIQTDNLSQMSPAGLGMKKFPQSTKRKDSNSSQGGSQIGFQTPSGSQTPYISGQNGKHAQMLQGIGGSQRKLDIGKARNSAYQASDPSPVINVQRPRLNNIPALTNNSMANSTKEKISISVTNGQKKTFAIPGETRTTKLRAAAKAKESQTGTTAKSNTDRGILQPPTHMRYGSDIAKVAVASKREVVCVTEPQNSSDEKKDEGTFDLTEDNSKSDIVTFGNDEDLSNK